MTRYQHLANLLTERIEQGLYRHGEKLPSVRSLSQEHGVSISTVQQAYQVLESLQLITPQPRSGYFVAPQKALPPVPPMSRPVQRPVEITQWEQVLGYDELAGSLALRQQIARLMLDGGSVVNADDLVITSGSQSGM